jgi:hypothetical protein
VRSLVANSQELLLSNGSLLVLIGNVTLGVSLGGNLIDAGLIES